MSERFYPPINEQSLSPLKVARRLALEDPSYLKDVACPYGPEVREFLQSAEEKEKPTKNTEPVDTLAEVEGLYQSIKDYGSKVLAGSDASDKNTYFRVSSSLLERLVTLKERAVGAKNVAEFTSAVLDILEDELTADQRTAILAKLKRILAQ
jgi:hypothetical protein